MLPKSPTARIGAPRARRERGRNRLQRFSPNDRRNMAIETATTFRSRARNPATRDQTVAFGCGALAREVIDTLQAWPETVLNRATVAPPSCAYNRISQICAGDTLASFGGDHG